MLILLGNQGFRVAPRNLYIRDDGAAMMQVYEVDWDSFGPPIANETWDKLVGQYVELACRYLFQRTPEGARAEAITILERQGVDELRSRVKFLHDPYK